MKTIIRTKLSRAVCLLAVGMLLVWFSDRAPVWLVQGVGALLILPGLVSLLSLLRGERTRLERLLYPVVGVVTIVFGLLLILWPSFFVSASMYVLAVLLVILGLHQVYSRWNMQKMGIDISGATFLMPAIAMATGIFVLLYRDLAAAIPFIVLGAAYIMYSLLELWSAVSIAKYVRQHHEAVEPAGACVQHEPEPDGTEVVEAETCEDDVAEDAAGDGADAERKEVISYDVETE